MTGEPPIDPRAHRVLAGATRVRVLRLLRDSWPEPMTAADLAARLDVHPNTVRLHLDQLLDAGLVERRSEHRSGPGRPRLLFAARPGTTVRPDGPEGYRTLAGILAGQLARQGGGGPGAAIDAGRAWGRSLPAEFRSPAAPGGERTTAEQATGRLVHLMDRLGFAPSVPSPGEPIELHSCPFSDVAAEQPEVVCGVHLGLMTAVLEDLDAPLRADRLEPFAAPGVCRAHLSPPARPESSGSGPGPEVVLRGRASAAPPPPAPDQQRTSPTERNTR